MSQPDLYDFIELREDMERQAEESENPIDDDGPFNAWDTLVVMIDLLKMEIRPEYRKEVERIVAAFKKVQGWL